LIQNLTGAVAAARPPEKRSSSLLIRIIDFLFPDILFGKETPINFTGRFLTVKSEKSSNTSSNTIALHLEVYLEAAPKTVFA
jgi:hypothetical protein